MAEPIQRIALRKLLKAVYNGDCLPELAADRIIDEINANYDLKVCEYCLKSDCTCGHQEDKEALKRDGGLPF